MEEKKRTKKKSGSRLAKPAGKRLDGKQKVLIALIVVLAIALCGVLGYRALFVRPEVGSSKPGKQPNAPTQETQEIDYGDGVRPVADGERKSEDYYTVLVLGRDTGGGGNTDTMLLASYDVTNQKATVMSIPRDTMVNVNWDVKKINSVYNVYGGGDKGIDALYKEIAQLVGFEPDYRVVVEWEAVGAIVDAIGGVYFDVPYPMDYHDPYQDLVIEQAPGYRLLSGKDAMQVIRWRGNDNDSPYGYRKKDGGIGDSGRMKVQQDFLKAVIEQLANPANVLNIGKLSKVFQENVETDLSFQNILWFGQKAFTGGLRTDDVTFMTMPWRGTSAWSRSYKQNLSYVVPVAKELLDIVNNQLSPFKQVFTMSNLDIMSVNSDGSISSTTGHVEDSAAAKAPERPAGSKDTSFTLDESGNLVDPNTGAVVQPAPDTPDVTEPQPPVVLPGEGETPSNPGGTTVEEPKPQQPAEPDPTPPAEPDPVPSVEPDPGFDGGFTVIETEPENG